MSIGQHFKVAIIGGGPAGIGAAVGLAKRANCRLSISPQPCLAKRRRATVSRFRGAANGSPQKPSPRNLA